MDVPETRDVTQQNTPDSASDRSCSHRGQGLLEFALFLPLLLLMISGMIEIGMYANDYLTILDASREAARFGANLDPELTSQDWFDMRDGAVRFPDVRPPSIGGIITPTGLLYLCGQGETTNFYYEVACLAYQNVPLGDLDPVEGDDIVVTVIGVLSDTAQIVHRWPITHTNPLTGHNHPDDQSYHFRGVNTDGDANPTCTITQTENCRCWSLYGLRSSGFDNAAIESKLRVGAPSTGFVIVEIFHAHHHLIGFFTIGEFIPDPLQIRAFTIFPVPAAEPDD
jgi:hypothetical protein